MGPLNPKQSPQKNLATQKQSPKQSRPGHLEIKSRSRLERPVVVILRLNQSEWIRAVDIERRIIRIRMVHHIQRIEPQFHALPFR